MDLKDPKNQVLILVAIVFVALIYVWYAKFYTPYNAELASKKAEYQKLNSELFAVKQKAQSLEGLQKDVNFQRAKYEKVKLLLPEVREDEAFLHQLHMAAQYTNSTIITVTPQASTPMEFYTANDYVVELETTYHGLGNFFARVVNFPFMVTISDVAVKSREEKQSSSELAKRKRKDLTVSATFKLTTYNTQPTDLGGQTQ